MVNKKHSKATVSEVYRSKYALVLVLIIIDFMMIMMVENQWIDTSYVITGSDYRRFNRGNRFRV